MISTQLYVEAESFCRLVRQPGTGRISDASDLDVSPDGTCAVFAGALVESPGFARELPFLVDADGETVDGKFREGLRPGVELHFFRILEQ